MSANSGQWRMQFWQDDSVWSDGLILGDGGENGCLPLPPSGLGVPGQSTQDAFTVQRDGVEMYRDTYGPRAVEFSLEFTNQDCPGGDLRQAVAQVLKQWNRNCSGATLLIFSDCLPDDFTIPDDVSSDPEERAVIGPYILHGRPRRAVVNHSRSNIGHSVIDMMFEADDQAIGVVQPALIDDTPTEFECLTTNAPSGTISLTYSGDVESYPIITLTGSMTAPIEVQGTSGTIGFTYTDDIPAGETVVIDVRSGRALRSYGATFDVTLLLSDAFMSQLIIRPDPFGNPQEFILTSSGADTGNMEVCYGTYVVGV